MSVKIEGVKETLKELRKISPELQKEFKKEARAVVKPIIDTAKQNYRARDYPSGTARNWQRGGRQLFPLSADRAAAEIKPSFSTSKKNASTFLVIQKNPGAAIFEFADNGSLGRAFQEKNGRPARVVWPAAIANQTKVVAEMTELVHKVEREIYATIRGK